jgi:hypothetical protein
MNPAAGTTLAVMFAYPSALRRGRAAGGAALLAVSLVVSLASCSSSGGGHHDASAPTAPSSVTATRWWSNSAAQVGSTIDPKNPAADAARLTPSRTEYCGMLKDTVSAGKSILPGVTATDPALLTSAEAFVDEIEKVAPGPVSSPWQVIGGAILALVKSGGKASTALKSINIGAVTQAASTISTDSKQNCGVDLSSVTGGVGLAAPSPTK